MTNINRDPLLRAIYAAAQAVEACGASEALTAAVMAVTAIYQHAERALDARDAALARAEKAEKDAERHLDLLRQARHYVADKRLNEDELGGRRRRETNQDAADRISMAMENNEVRANLLEAITAAIDAARAEG